MAGPTVDGVLVQWGERLFYPRNRIVPPSLMPRLSTLNRRKAAVIRQRIAVVVRRAPQVIVKFVNGGRGMRAIGQQFDYVTRGGALEFEDDRGVKRSGKDDLQAVEQQWRLGGSLIDKESDRYEALFVTMSMPRGTDPALVLEAARSVAKAEMPDNRYILVLHRQQAHPHVHIVARIQSRTEQRLNPYLKRHEWRERFARELRRLGVDADATRQSTRGENRVFQSPWEAKHHGASGQALKRASHQAFNRRAEMMRAWAHVIKALSASPDQADRQLAEQATAYVRRTPFIAELAAAHDAEPRRSPTNGVTSPSIERERGRDRFDLTR